MAPSGSRARVAIDPAHLDRHVICSSRKALRPRAPGGDPTANGSMIAIRPVITAYRNGPGCCGDPRSLLPAVRRTRRAGSSCTVSVEQPQVDVLERRIRRGHGHVGAAVTSARTMAGACASVCDADRHRSIRARRRDGAQRPNGLAYCANVTTPSTPNRRPAARPRIECQQAPAQHRHPVGDPPRLVEVVRRDQAPRAVRRGGGG